MVKALNSAGITPILSLKNVHATACQGLACAPPKICAVPEEDVVAALKGLVWVRFYGKLAANLVCPRCNSLVYLEIMGPSLHRVHGCQPDCPHTCDMQSIHWHARILTGLTVRHVVSRMRCLKVQRACQPSFISEAAVQLRREQSTDRDP